MPSGAIDVCGSRPSRRATCLVGSDEISAPSSSTEPARGLSMRTSARSSVDLPHAFGPTIAVKPPSGMSTDRLSRDDGPVVGERHPRALSGAVAAALMRVRISIRS